MGDSNPEILQSAVNYSSYNNSQDAIQQQVSNHSSQYSHYFNCVLKNQRPTNPNEFGVLINESNELDTFNLDLRSISEMEFHSVNKDQHFNANAVNKSEALAASGQESMANNKNENEMTRERFIANHHHEVQPTRSLPLEMPACLIYPVSVWRFQMIIKPN